MRGTYLRGLGRSDPQTHGDTERMIVRSATTPSSSLFSYSRINLIYF